VLTVGHLFGLEAASLHFEEPGIAKDTSEREGPGCLSAVGDVDRDATGDIILSGKAVVIETSLACASVGISSTVFGLGFKTSVFEEDVARLA
jgi:hypothetical protein